MKPEELIILKRDYYSKIFPALGVSLLFFFVILVYASFTKSFGLYFWLLTLAAIIIGIILFNILTQKHRFDLKSRKIIIETKTIEKKFIKTDYEAGSATVPVNMLSLLFFKKIFKREMKEIVSYFVKTEDEDVYLNKSQFEKCKIGQTIIVRKTEKTNLFLSAKV